MLTREEMDERTRGQQGRCIPLVTPEMIVMRAEENKRRRRFQAIYFLVVCLFFICARLTPNGYWWISRNMKLWEGIFIGSVGELVMFWISKWCGDRLYWLEHFTKRS